MADPELMSYVQSTLAKGYSQEQVKKALLSQGWSEPDVNEAMSLALKQASSQPKPILNTIENLGKPSTKWFAILSIIVLIGGVSIFFIFSGKESQVQEPLTQINDGQGTGNSNEATEFTYYEDCGSSESCFTEFAKTCTKAEALITLSEASIKLVYRETIEGFEKNDCILTLVYTSSSIQGFVGKDMKCKIPKRSLENYKDYLQGERMQQACEGPLVDFLIEQGAV